MRDYPELLILRHGETEWNRLGRMQGTLDSPLTETGRGPGTRRRQRKQGRPAGTSGFLPGDPRFTGAYSTKRAHR